MWRRKEWRWLLCVLIVSVVALPTLALAADDNDNGQLPTKKEPETSQQTAAPALGPPDLEIQFAGFNAPGVNDQLIKFSVTNRGIGPSVATVARVVTLKPEPTPWFR